MYSTFPTVINPWALAQQADLVTGKVDLSQMERVIASQNKQQGDVQVGFQITKIEKDKLLFQGQLSYDLALDCQRCLEEMPMTYQFEFELIIVKQESTLKTLTDDEDGMVCEENLDLIQLLEDEVLLRLPMIAKHDDCAGLDNEEKQEQSGQTPFASLKDLMN